MIRLLSDRALRWVSRPRKWWICCRRDDHGIEAKSASSTWKRSSPRSSAERIARKSGTSPARTARFSATGRQDRGEAKGAGRKGHRKPEPTPKLGQTDAGQAAAGQGRQAEAESETPAEPPRAEAHAGGAGWTVLAEDAATAEDGPHAPGGSPAPGKEATLQRRHWRRLQSLKIGSRRSETGGGLPRQRPLLRPRLEATGVATAPEAAADGRRRRRRRPADATDRRHNRSRSLRSSGRRPCRGDGTACRQLPPSGRSRRRGQRRRGAERRGTATSKPATAPPGRTTCAASRQHAAAPASKLPCGPHSRRRVQPACARTAGDGGPADRPRSCRPSSACGGGTEARRETGPGTTRPPAPAESAGRPASPASHSRCARRPSRPLPPRPAVGGYRPPPRPHHRPGGRRSQYRRAKRGRSAAPRAAPPPPITRTDHPRRGDDGQGAWPNASRSTPKEILKKLIERRVMLTINTTLDAETATTIAREFGADVTMRTFEEEMVVLESEGGESRGHGHPRAGRHRHGTRRPWQDDAARCDPRNEGGRGRGGRHHAAHRRLRGRDQRAPDRLPRHAGPRGVHARCARAARR